MSSVRKSTPPTSSPIAFTARSAMERLSGWTISVISMAVPPVDKFAVERKNNCSPFLSTVSRLYPLVFMSRSAWWSTWIFVRTFSCPIPRRGSEFTMSINLWIECFPSPVTCPGTRFATAMSFPFTTSMR